MNNNIDKNNYLIQFSNWNLDIANEIAKREKVVLTSKHLELIYILREFYIKNKIYPNARIILTLLKKKKKFSSINSCYINSLFPGNSILKLMKISGIPNLNNCI